MLLLGCRLSSFLPLHERTLQCYAMWFVTILTLLEVTTVQLLSNKALMSNVGWSSSDGRGLKMRLIDKWRWRSSSTVRVVSLFVFFIDAVECFKLQFWVKKSIVAPHASSWQPQMRVLIKMLLNGNKQRCEQLVTRCGLKMRTRRWSRLASNCWSKTRTVF